MYQAVPDLDDILRTFVEKCRYQCIFDNQPKGLKKGRNTLRYQTLDALPSKLHSYIEQVLKEFKADPRMKNMMPTLPKLIMKHKHAARQWPHWDALSTASWAQAMGLWSLFIICTSGYYLDVATHNVPFATRTAAAGVVMTPVPSSGNTLRWFAVRSDVLHAGAAGKEFSEENMRRSRELVPHVEPLDCWGQEMVIHIYLRYL